METMSMVEICGTNRIKCGYCKPSTKTSVSYGLLAKRLTCTDYQELIDRGWRRSGTFVYKPVMHETCCPQYTIRLDVTRFKHTKGHRQVLNRLKRYLEGDRQSSSEVGGGGHADSGGRTNRDGSRGALKGKQASTNGNSWRRIPEEIGTLCELVAAAAFELVEGGTVLGLNFGPEWRSEVAGWSQVRPIRNNQNKKAVPSGGGFCSAVALSIASAARKRGWKGTGVAGGAVAIAEAMADLLRSGSSEEGGRARLSAISVAPNGFINFEADFRPSSTMASSNHDQLPPENALPEARYGGSPNQAVTPPLPPAPSLALHGDISLTNSASDSERKTSKRRTSVKEEVAAEREVGGAASSAGLKSTGAAAGSTKTVLASSGGAAALPAGDPQGQLRAVAGGQDDGSLMAAAARMEWIERQGNNDGAVDMEVCAVTSNETSTAGPSNSEPKTGLASLPPLDPRVAPHRMTVSTVPARVTDEVFRLYVKYQVSVHGDDPSEVTPGQFRRFLVDSPLIRETIGGKMIRPRKPSTRQRPSSRSAMVIDDESKGVTQGESSEIAEGQDSLSVPYGSYHQLYRIDGKLIAVGVVDILPKCLSSVYCFYDPDYRALALGKLTALKETEFIKEAHVMRPGLKDYYMGFYIHSCPKMSYKGSYTPSFLLCPERLTWVPLELCRPVLDAHKYARLSDLLGPPQLSQTSGGVDKGAEVSNGNRRDGGNLTAGFEGAAGSPAHRSPGSGSFSPLSSLSPDRREARQRRPRKEAPTRPVPADGAGANLFGGHGGGEETVGMTTGTARRAAAAARAVRAAANEASRIDEIPLMLGHPAFPVNLKALTPQSQALVRDVLMTYAATIGSDLARRVVLKLHD